MTAPIGLWFDRESLETPQFFSLFFSAYGSLLADVKKKLPVDR